MGSTFWMVLGLGVMVANGGLAQAQGAVKEKAAVGGNVAAPSKIRGVREGAPEKLLTEDVKEFFQFLNTAGEPRDLFIAAQQGVKVERRGYLGANEWARYWSIFKGGPVRAFINDPVELDALKIESLGGHQATVVLKYSLEIQRPIGSQWKKRSFEEKLNLSWENVTEEKGQKWLFLPTPPEEGELPQTAPLRWAVYMLAQPPGSLARFRATNAVEQLEEHLPLGVMLSRAGLTKQNLTQLGAACLQSVREWDSRFAFESEFVEEALRPYLKDEKVWIMPDAEAHYSFNKRLAGKRLAEVRDAAHTILFYEGRDEKPLLRYGGKAAVCFVDGRFRLTETWELETLRWEP